MALVVQLLVGGAFLFAVSQNFWQDGDAGAATRTPRVDRFDAPRAMRLLREQVEAFGPRPAGSAASARLGERLRTLLPDGRFEPIPGHPGLRNVVGSLPGRGKAIVVGAHYDTEARPVGHVGANDGAAGTAAVVELARTLRRAQRPAGAPPLRFVLFDGEEEPAGCTPFIDCGLRGSKAYVKAHGGATRAMVLLDYIAEKNTRIPREATSDEALWARLRTSAQRVGVATTFPGGDAGGAVLDDHTPFLEARIPAIDLIDFQYPQRDTLQDDLSRVSTRSLDAVGETVADLLLDD